MGFRSTSTRRTSAASAVSSQSVVVNTSTGFAAVGATIKSNTAISLGVTTSGQTSAATVTTVSAGPVISNIAYLDANNSVTSANAVSTSGGNIRITGTGFVANSAVYINNTLATNTFVSSTQITAVCPAASAGNVAIMIFTPTNSGTISASGVRYSGAPSWTTAAAALQNGIAANVSLVASSDSTLTYTLQAGSTLPTGISLNSAGYLTGTPTGYSNSASVSVVIIATDVEGQATQQTITISITTGDDQFKYTSLLLNGETSVTPFIKDASTNNFGLTLAGDVRADRFSPYYGNGYYSNSFNGSTDYFTVPSNAALQLGTGDFTIELWFMIVGAGDNRYQHIVQSRDGTNNGFLVQYDRTNGTIELTSDTGFTGALSANSAVLDNTWYHFAATRSGSSVKIFLNGTQVGTTVTSAQNLTASGPVYVSRRWVTDGALHYVNGYISNLRILKGTALYTSNFTPSTAPLTAIANTSLLTCQSNRFIDTSSNAFALTLAGTPKVSTAIPFAASSSYATYGSMYVPTAVTNYLALPSTSSTKITSGSTDSFIAECWVYFNSATASTAIIDQSGANTVTFQNWSLNLDSAKKFQIIWGGTGSPGSQIGYISGTTVAASGTWYHLAYVKTGAVWSLFVNGLRETTFSGLNTASDGTSNPLRIGSDTFSAQSINGYIADVRVYKGATAGAPYDASSATITIPTAPLVAVTNTQLLTCQYNGGANNSGIVDNGPFNNIITRAGNASQGTFSPYSQTGWSTNFNRSRVDATLTGKSPGTGSFTYELFFNVTVKDAAIANVAALFSTRGGGTGADGFDVQITTAGAVQIGTSGATLFTSSNSLVTNGLWYHLAIVRNGTTDWTVYLNGSSIGTLSNSTNFTSVNLYLGVFGGNTQDWFKGYISNFRYTRDAVYTSNFTPSITPLAVIANTEFLVCQANRYKDNSANNFAVTPVALNGSSSVQAVSPFSPSAAYTPSLHSGSAYFDGTGDYLQTSTYSTNLSPGTSDFTIEFWVYSTSSARQDWINLQAASGFNRILIFYNGSAIRYDAGDSGAASARISYTTPATTYLNGWHHIALSRAAGSSRLFLDGVQISTTYTDALNWTNPLQLTTMRDPNGSTYASGSIADIRIVKGAALYTANFAPPTAPLTSPTALPASLLLNFTNGGIVDAHSSNNVETVGNAQVSTAVTKYGNASMYFGGNQALLFPGSSIPGGAGSAFTVEFWINAPSVNSLTIMRANGNASSLGLSTSASGQLIVSNTFAADFYTSTSTLSPNVWTHVAIVRNSSNLYTVYFNGVSAGTAVTYATSIGTATQIYIAYNTYTTGYSTFYLDDFRVTNGFARYTANFTAPTSALLGQ
jgi:hypothetical protein